MQAGAVVFRLVSVQTRSAKQQKEQMDALASAFMTKLNKLPSLMKLYALIAKPAGFPVFSRG